MSADITVPQQWGLEIQNHPAQMAAIKYRSRFTDKACLATFERPGTRAQLKESVLDPVNQNSDALDWLTKHQIILV